MNKYSILIGSLMLGNLSWSFGEPSIQKAKPIYNPSPNLNCTATVPNTSEPEKIRFIKNWSAYVAQKSFTFAHNNIDSQLKQLQFCYSKAGWSQFSEALEKSRNINLISQHQLVANTHIIGPIEINHHPQYSSWTAVVPLRVVYQNQKQKISQELNVHLTINQLRNNQLSVIQIVGKPANRKLPGSK